MITLKWTEEVLEETKKLTKLLVDICYSQISGHNKHQPMAMSVSVDEGDYGNEDADIQFKKIYEAGISDKDSILDVGCGAAHLYTYLKNQGWNGNYLGIDPAEGIDLIDENINTIRCTIEDLDDTKYDWVVANSIFDLSLIYPVVTPSTTNVDRFNPEIGTNTSRAWVHIICNLISEENSLSIIENMISHANKGIVFNMIQVPHGGDDVTHNSKWIKTKLQKYNHSRIEIIEDYMKNDREFMVYFYV